MKNRLFKRLGSLAVAGMMFVCYPLAASAAQYNISQGNISVLASFENGQTKYKVNGNDVDDTEIEITGYNGVNAYYVEITSGDGASALIRFKDLYIDNSTVDDGFAVITGGDGKVEIELDGDNTLKGGSNRAGLQKGNVELLVIKDADGTAGKLAATGGESGAGIGGGYQQSVDKIVIEGGTITATSEMGGAGIGGGYNGSGTVTISWGTVEATGGHAGAGIGGGYDGSGTVTIEEGTVKAIGGAGGAGIGGGVGGSGTVTISGGNVTAIGVDCGAGIGGGTGGSGEVTISGDTVEATGGAKGAGIGGGSGGSGTVTISGGTVVATSEKSGAGIGGGIISSGSTITVSGSANVSARGGSDDSIYGPGASIGEGGTFDDNNYDLVPGADVAPDTSGLYTTGSITTYDVGTPLDAIKQGTASGNTIVGTVPDPNANTNTTTPEEPKVNEPKAEEPKKEEPKGEEPKIEEPPVYTERSCIADVDVAALVGALLSTNASATTLDIEFEDNICLNPEIMTALFADNRVEKNCFFRHKGKRYALHIGAVNKQSSLYAEDFEKLAEEPDGLAGFMMMAKIFANLGVTMTEVQ